MDLYKIIESEDKALFTDEVNRTIRNGWVCQGGVYFQKMNGKTYYCQAMIRIEIVSC